MRRERTNVWRNSSVAWGSAAAPDAGRAGRLACIDDVRTIFESSDDPGLFCEIKVPLAVAHARKGSGLALTHLGF